MICHIGDLPLTAVTPHAVYKGLQTGEAVAVIAITSIAGNVSGISAGIIVFGDPLGSDAAAVISRSLAFDMVIVAAALVPAPVRVRDRPEATAETVPSA